MSIALFSEVLANFPAPRCAELQRRVPKGIECVYVLVWPDYADPDNNSPARNREAFKAWRQVAGVQVWAWINAQEDLAATATGIAEIERDLNPDGYLLDIEGRWVQGANLAPLIKAVKATGKPCRASLAGTSSSHVEYDYRGLDGAGFTIDWQTYWISGEGPTPADGLRELMYPSFVIDGWQYRHSISASYGWGRFLHGQAVALRGMFDSYKIPGSPNCHFAVRARAWGWEVANRKLYSDGRNIGTLLGRAKHTNMRCTLDVSRGAADKYTLPEWTAWAASAKVPGFGKKPVSVYLAEVAPDDVLIAIGAGSA